MAVASPRGAGSLVGGRGGPAGAEASSRGAAARAYAGRVPRRAKLAILALLLTTAPPVLGIPLVFPVGGGSIQFADPILPFCAVLLSRGLLGRKGAGGVVVMAYAVALLVVIGLLQGAEIRWVIRDLRPLMYGVAGAAIGMQLAYAGAATHRWAARATAVYLAVIALMVLATQLGPIAFVGDPGDSNTVYWGTRVIELEGVRTLLPTNALSSMVMIALLGGFVASVPLRAVLGRRVVPVLFVSAGVILFFSYSRNTALGIGAGLFLGLLFPLGRRSLQWSRMMVALMVVVAVVVPAAFVMSTTGVGRSYVDAYAERVLGGLRSDNLKIDASVRFRRDETAAARQSISEHPLTGRGAGVFYRPLFRNDAFQEDGGRLYTHNYWLWTMVKGGAAYFFAIVALLAWSLSRLALGRTGLGRPAERLALIGIVGLGAIAWVAPWPGEPYGASFFFAVVAMGWVTVPRRDGAASGELNEPGGGGAGRQLSADGGDDLDVANAGPSLRL